MYKYMMVENERARLFSIGPTGQSKRQKGPIKIQEIP